MSCADFIQMNCVLGQEGEAVDYDSCQYCADQEIVRNDIADLFGKEQCEDKSAPAGTNQDDWFESNMLVILPVAAGGIMLIVVCIMIIIRRSILNKRIAETRKDITVDADTFCIRNGLAVVIAIGEYDDEDSISSNAELEDVALRDISVFKDVENLKGFFRFLRWNLIPKTTKFYWTEHQLFTLLKTDITKELFEGEELKYDGLIVLISAHGIENKIVSSDYRTIEKTAIHRIVSLQNPKIREIPRIFIFDSCDGGATRKQVKESTEIQRAGESSPKSPDRAKSISLSDVMTSNDWTTDTKNPDYNLVVVHAANRGYQAKINSQIGSYLINEFTQTRYSFY